MLVGELQTVKNDRSENSRKTYDQIYQQNWKKFPYANLPNNDMRSPPLRVFILTYNELDHSLPACLPVSTNFKYYYHCGVGKKIGLVIWTDFLSGVKVCNNPSL